MKMTAKELIDAIEDEGGWRVHHDAEGRREKVRRLKERLNGLFGRKRTRGRRIYAKTASVVDLTVQGLVNPTTNVLARLEDLYAVVERERLAYVAAPRPVVLFADRNVGERFQMDAGGSSWVVGTKSGLDSFRYEDGSERGVSIWTKTRDCK